MALFAKKNHIAILDYVRALVMIRIFLYHYYLAWFGGAYFVVPEGIWVNLGKLWVFEGPLVLGGFWDFAGLIFALIKNIFSWVFIYGFASVNVFLILSGFVLTLSLLNKGGIKKERGDGDLVWKFWAGSRGVWNKFCVWVKFYWKRLKRILIPFYISVLAGILFWYSRNLFFPQFADWPLFDMWDLGKLLIVPYLFFDTLLLQKFSGDYWYIVLILQLYLLFPVLFYLLKKIGIWKFLLLSAVLTFTYRFYAAYFLDGVPMGVYLPTEHSYRFYSFFLPRLFEFSLGMVFGAMYFKNEKLVEEFKRLRWFMCGVVSSLLGFVFLMYRFGWIFADALMGFGLFFVFLGIANFLTNFKWIRNYLQKIGDSAYELYLWHHYFLNYILFYLFAVLGLSGNEWVFWGVMPIYFVTVVWLGYFGKYLSDGAEWVYRRIRGRV